MFVFVSLFSSSRVRPTVYILVLGQNKRDAVFVLWCSSTYFPNILRTNNDSQRHKEDDMKTGKCCIDWFSKMFVFVGAIHFGDFLFPRPKSVDLKRYPCNCYYNWARLFLALLLQDLQQISFCIPLRSKSLLDAESMILPSKYFRLCSTLAHVANLLRILSQPPSQQRAGDWRPYWSKTIFRPAHQFSK